MLRILALAGAVAGGVGLSQFPEFSQQYLQRLAGQVDALSEVVRDFDATATRNLLTREQALADMTGTAFLEDRRSDLTRTFARHDRLSANLADLRAASPLQRLTMPQKLGDGETLAATWADFRPAVPVTTDGLITAGIGFLGGWLVTTGLLGLLAWPFRRRRAV
ncbi:DUF2937 family protein [Gemmobacter caeruleus]|uniref:DUF2937 family protein n=1 Tax=Gemmobacter caeruleus TaxID=2595004 RepID=UPI0011ECD0B3|nr:DUF2937 family protein [Gemmobacter caeruleus]